MARPATLAIVLVAAAVIVAAAVGGRYLAEDAGGTSSPQARGRLVDFPCVERSGRATRTSEVLGSFVVADFVFTSCQNQCPRLQAKMRELQDSAPELRLVSFTVDPDRDTIERLAAWASSVGADPARWLFLRASTPDLRRLMVDELHLAETKDPTLHSDAFILFDPKGVARGAYRPLDEPGWRERLLADVGRSR